MKILDFKQNPFKMKINPVSGDSRTSRSCFRARLVFRWKTWVNTINSAIIFLLNVVMKYETLNEKLFSFY